MLHGVIREHLEPFLREAADRGDGHGLPRFVEQEFREFLTCGVLAHGFTRLRCADCAFERLFGRMLRGIRRIAEAFAAVDDPADQDPDRRPYSAVMRRR